MTSSSGNAASIRIAIIVAASRNNAIGYRDALPWRISDDLKWFKEKTLGKPIIMGRKTYESIGKALPGRDNIVVTRSQDFVAPGAFIVHDAPDAFTLARHCATARGVDEICIIGGAKIYALTLDLADRIYLTKVGADVEGDAFFPMLNAEEWGETWVGECAQNDRNSHSCEFFILERRK